MIQYHCDQCNMGVAGLTCSHCGAELQPQRITNAEGKEIQVAECPKGCGKIQSPMCCGHDMRAKHP